MLLPAGDSEGSKAVKTVWDETLNRKESVVQDAFCQLKIALVKKPQKPQSLQLKTNIFSSNLYWQHNRAIAQALPALSPSQQGFY